MKSPEEEAKELVESFGNIHPLRMILTNSTVNRISKQCALIHVEKMINRLNGYNDSGWHVDEWQFKELNNLKEAIINY